MLNAEGIDNYKSSRVYKPHKNLNKMVNETEHLSPDIVPCAESEKNHECFDSGYNSDSPVSPPINTDSQDQQACYSTHVQPQQVQHKSIAFSGDDLRTDFSMSRVIKQEPVFHESRVAYDCQSSAMRFEPQIEPTDRRRPLRSIDSDLRWTRNAAHHVAQQFPVQQQQHSASLFQKTDQSPAEMMNAMNHNRRLFEIIQSVMAKSAPPPPPLLKVPEFQPQEFPTSYNDNRYQRYANILQLNNNRAWFAQRSETYRRNERQRVIDNQRRYPIANIPYPIPANRQPTQLSPDRQAALSMNRTSMQTAPSMNGTSMQTAPSMHTAPSINRMSMQTAPSMNRMSVQPPCNQPTEMALPVNHQTERVLPQLVPIPVPVVPPLPCDRISCTDFKSPRPVNLVKAYEPKYFQNLPKEHIDKLSKEHSISEGEEEAEEEKGDDKENVKTSEKSDDNVNIVDLMEKCIVGLLERGVMDLSPSTSSLSQLFQDKLDGVKTLCTCQKCGNRPMRGYRPPRDSVKKDPLAQLCYAKGYKRRIATNSKPKRCANRLDDRNSLVDKPLDSFPLLIPMSTFADGDFVSQPVDLSIVENIDSCLNLCKSGDIELDFDLNAALISQPQCDDRDFDINMDDIRSRINEQSKIFGLSHLPEAAGQNASPQKMDGLSPPVAEADKGMTEKRHKLLSELSKPRSPKRHVTDETDTESWSPKKRNRSFSH